MKNVVKETLYRKAARRQSSSPAADELAAAVSHCEAIAAGSPNHLHAVAQRLDHPVKRRLFLVCYAAMRVIDDAVDKRFLARPAAERTRTRGAMGDLLARWLDQAIAAAAGTFVPDAAAFEPEVFVALNHYAGASNIGADPWRKLAAALRRDVEEQPLATWDDFAAYGEGAAVAPATIFLYILACRVTDGHTTCLAGDVPLADFARDMAIFCYLVHILRDLPVDATKSAQLLTIPAEAIRATGLDEARLRSAVAIGDHALLAPLLEAILERVRAHKRGAERALEKFTILLNENERSILADLYGRYLAVHDAIVADHSVIFARPTGHPGGP